MSFLLSALAGLLPTIGKAVLPQLITMGAKKFAGTTLGNAIKSRPIKSFA
jgi:hypothetical protein